MRIKIKVIAGAKKDCIQKDQKIWKVHLRAPALEDKANKALIELLAEDLRLPKSKITIIKGLKSRDKLINIEKN